MFVGMKLVCVGVFCCSMCMFEGERCVGVVFVFV